MLRINIIDYGYQNRSREKACLFSLVLLKAIYEAGMVLYIIPTYQYDAKYDIVHGVISYILLAVTFYSYPKNSNRPSSYAYTFLQCFIYIPILAISWLVDVKFEYVYLVSACMIVIAIVSRIRIGSLSILSKDHATLIFYILFCVYIVLAAYLVMKRGGIDRRALSLDDLYALREENNLTGLSSYLINWCAKSFFPVYCLYFYYGRHKGRMLICVFTQLLLYLSTGDKSYVLSIGLILAIIILYSLFNLKKWLPYGLGILTALSYCVYTVFSARGLLTVFLYRLVTIPAAINFRYYEYMSDHKSYLYFAETFVGRLFGLSSPFKIGFSYFISDTDAQANTGLFGDAFANGGFPVMLIYSVILGLILALFDKLGERQRPMVIGILSYMIINLMDVPLLTNLITGGILITIILLIISYSTLSDTIQI